MGKPKGCNDLNKSQRKKYDDLLKKETLTDSEIIDLGFLNDKIAKFNNPDLSMTAIKYMIKRYAWEKYNKGSLSVVDNKSSIVKGNELEPMAIKCSEEMDGVKYDIPSDFKYNDYIFGKCDGIDNENGKIVDVKVSWAIHSFLPNHISNLSTKYWYQAQGYMELYNLDKAEVKFVLLNTPEYLINKERVKYIEKYQIGEIDSDKYEEEMEKLDLCYDYSKIPKKRKIITFVVNRDKEAIKRVYLKIEKCRKWLKEFDKLHIKNKPILVSSDKYLNVTEEDNPDSNTP